MNLSKLFKIFGSYDCSRVYVKVLSPNDNSKNQVYLAGGFEILNMLPSAQISTDDSGDWIRTRFKSKLNFFWIDDEGGSASAPEAQLILYPKYPEVRFSGFLLRCRNAPSELMTSRLAKRLLFLGVGAKDKIYGYVTSPDSGIAKEYADLPYKETEGIFHVFHIEKWRHGLDSRQELLQELRRIHQKGWILGKRLNSKHEILPCVSSNCGGYTLEAELGITPNGYSKPDFLGWEIKQFGVPSFDQFAGKVITLMTPEPNGGIYVDHGVKEFINKYGYLDKRGRADRYNFGGIHKVGLRHPSTGLILILDGYDIDQDKIIDTGGAITLLDVKGNVCASWSFASLLEHWVRKHNQASYIPTMVSKNQPRNYAYGNNIILGTGPVFTKVLRLLAQGHIYYDPGIKMEFASSKPKIKRRSQFRIKSGFLPELYVNHEVVDVLKT